MDRDPNYVAVGAFVVLLAAMATGFVLWYSESGDRRSYVRHEIYFDGSVFGLSEGSSVRYLGVAVGRVLRIGLDPRDPSRVRVVANISEDTPIHGDTVARLALQGVTGLLFVDLKPADPSRPKLDTVPSLQYPVIPSERSEFDVFLSSLPDVVAQAGEVLNRLNEILSDQNVESINAVIANFDRSTQELPEAMADARRLLANVNAAVEEIRGAAGATRDLAASTTPDVRFAMARLRAAADSIAEASARMNQLIAANEASVNRFGGQGLAEFEALVRDLRETARSVEQLGRSLEQDPSRLLYQPSTRGVEIPP
ncbi:MAG: MlaD family protein [Steroidobacteraceae bacterium]|jgi:phospholipid/cholesterol/gamma-HCH transport system substrate-binding protein|nr:MlaD family protein [Steroidobacteraceae bacterium]